MYVTKPLAILAMASTGFSYMVKLYEDSGCKGGMREINVYDNTCSTPGADIGWRSIEVTAYGAGRQRATFYEARGGCDAVGGRTVDWWADGGGDTFKKGGCIDLGISAKSLGSRAA